MFSNPCKSSAIGAVWCSCATDIGPQAAIDRLGQVNPTVLFTTDGYLYKGKKFEIIAYNNSPENIYIQSVKLNGKNIDRLWIDHSEIVNGGKLELQMSKSPNLTLGK